LHVSTNLISPPDSRNFRAALLRWYRRRGRDLPWRRTRDPYAILVSEFMLQQTQVATVLSYYNEWLRRWSDFSALARASESSVLHAWQGLGYYARARNLHATARIVVDRYGGHLPKTIARTRGLPGIGRYSAHAIATLSELAIPNTGNSTHTSAVSSAEGATPARSWPRPRSPRPVPADCGRSTRR